MPLGLIFVVLFASADPIFRDAIADVLGFRIDLGDLPGRVLFTLAAAWLLAGAISVAATGLPDMERTSLGAAARTGPLAVGRWIGVPEALVILAVIDLVVGGFVAFQLAYLFGGLDTLQAAGITYAEYARRGFFELVAAACLALSVVVVLEAMVERRTRPYVATLVVLIALTGLVLVSASLRLQPVPGRPTAGPSSASTCSRRSPPWGPALVVMMGLVLTDLSRWLGHAVAILGLVSLVGLNAIAPAAFVAARNLERVVDASLVPPDGHSGLDAEYLALLPDDAIPVMVAALPRLPDAGARRGPRVAAPATIRARVRGGVPLAVRLEPGSRAGPGRAGDRAMTVPTPRTLRPWPTCASRSSRPSRRCSPRPSTACPMDDGWLFEPKWDGFRALVFRDGDDDLHAVARPQAPRPLLPGAR